MTRLAALLAGAAVLLAGCAPARTAPLAPIASAAAHAQPGVSQAASPSPPAARVAAVLRDGPVFGVLAHIGNAPAVIAEEIGCRPTWVGLFADVADGLTVNDLRKVQGVPVVTLEPWHPDGGIQQTDFRLSATIAGNWDSQYRHIAAAIRSYTRPVIVRFAHEMNGNWYPWGTGNGNTAGQYVAAWRHVVALFRAAGAANALWDWSPNSLDGTASSTIAQYYPGDTWVDFVGMTGYGTVNEPSPAATFTATINQIYRLTTKPVVIGETGARADQAKLRWIRGFGAWLAANPRVVAFMWTYWIEDKPGGFFNGTDFRFDDTTPDRDAFTSTLAAAHAACG